MSAFARWLAELFGIASNTQTENIVAEKLKENAAALELERLAIISAVGYLSAAVSQCTIRTFVGGEEQRGSEYYLWNVSPNENQNSTQFLQQLVETLVYNNEALIVEKKGRIYVADAFGTELKGLKGNRFNGIAVNGERMPDMYARDVIYLRLHNEDIRPLLSRVCAEYEEIIQMATNSYLRLSADKGILTMDAAATGGNSEERRQQREDLLNNKFKKFFSAQSAVLPLPRGYSYTSHTRSVRNVSELNDVKTMADEIYNRVGQAFHIPPVMLRGETAGTQEALSSFITFGVRPICNQLEEEANRKRYKTEDFYAGNYISVDTSTVEVGGIFGAADKADKLIASGLYSVDEIRQKVGEPLLGTEEANRHYITKNYAPIGEGGSQG